MTGRRFEDAARLLDRWERELQARSFEEAARRLESGAAARAVSDLAPLYGEDDYLVERLHAEIFGSGMDDPRVCPHCGGKL